MSSTTSLTWWPMKVAPYYLVDAPEDGRIEEWVCVPVRALGTEDFAGLAQLERACVEFIRGCPRGKMVVGELRRAGHKLELTRNATVWSRPDATRDASGNLWISVNAGEVCDECAGQPRGATVCPVCGGSGQRTFRYTDEECSWVVCERDEPNAVEFLCLDAVEAPSAAGAAQRMR